LVILEFRARVVPPEFAASWVLPVSGVSRDRLVRKGRLVRAVSGAVKVFVVFAGLLVRRESRAPRVVFVASPAFKGLQVYAVSAE
jgi:hypothetical protein